MVLVRLPCLLALLASSACAAEVEEAPPPRAPMPAASAPAEGFLIHLERPALVGVSVGIQGRAVKRTEKRLTIPGRAPTTEVMEDVVQIAGVLRVTAADPGGRATMTEVTIQECRFEGGGVTGVLVPPGAVLTVEAVPRPGEGHYRVAGRDLEPRTVELLDLLFDRQYGSVHDDDVFETRVPRHVGERWAPNFGLFVRELSQQLQGATISDARGEVTLQAVTSDRGRPVLDVGTQMALRLGGMPDLPPGSQLRQAGIVFAIRSLLPRDPSLPSLRGRFSMRLDADLSIPTPAGPADLAMTVSMDKEWQQELVDVLRGGR